MANYFPEEARFLEHCTVELDDGRRGYVFTYEEDDKEVGSYFCNVCQTVLFGITVVEQHIYGKRHSNGMNKSYHPHINFDRIVEEETSVKLQPDEPALLNTTDEVEPMKCIIQLRLDSFKSKPLIGLEYLVELIVEDTDPSYYCLLCNKQGVNNNIIVHLSSNVHYVNYLKKHFPSTHHTLINFRYTSEFKKQSSDILPSIIEAIENKYGRFKPRQCHNESFDNQKKLELIYAAENEFHSSGIVKDKFFEIRIWIENKNLKFHCEDVTVAAIDHNSNSIKDKELSSANKEKNNESLFNEGQQSKVNQSQYHEDGNPYDDKKIIDKSHGTVVGITKVAGLCSSESSSDQHRADVNSHHSRSRTRSPVKKKRRVSSRRSRSRSSHLDDKLHDLPPLLRRRTRRSTSRACSRSPVSKTIKRSISRDDKSWRYKWERLREDLHVFTSQLKDKHEDYEKNPKRHPLYHSEWNIFWKQRSKELKDEGKDPTKHDFQPEWVKFWKKRIKEIYDEEFKIGKEKIKFMVSIHDLKGKKLCSGDTTDNILLQEIKDGNVCDENIRRQLPVSPITEDNHLSSEKMKYGNGCDKNRIPLPASPITEDNHFLSEKMKYGNGSDKNRIPLPASPITEDNNFSSEKMKDGNVGDKNVRPLPASQIEKGIVNNISSTLEIREPILEDLSRKIHLLSKLPPPGARQGFMPFDDNSPKLISVLRMISALESQLGSLGPKIVDLLSKAIAMEKTCEGSSYKILCSEKQCLLLETVKERLKGVLYTGLMDRNYVNMSRIAIKSIDDLLLFASKLTIKEMPTPVATVASAPPATITIPALDIVAIAKKIAGSLIIQGKRDVSEEELEQLINVIVNQAFPSSAKPITTAEQVENIISHDNVIAHERLKLLMAGYFNENKVNNDSINKIPQQ